MTTATFESSQPVDNRAWERNASAFPVVRASSAESSLIQRVLKRVLNGEIECFYDLVRPYERAIFLAAHSLVKNEADAEEIVQKAVLKALKGLPRFRQEAKFST